MNDQTGEYYKFNKMKELEDKIKELELKNETLTLLQQKPDERCRCCKGTGSVQVKEPWYDERGKIRRYIPCFCTFDKGDSK